MSNISPGNTEKSLNKTESSNAHSQQKMLELNDIEMAFKNKDEEQDGLISGSAQQEKQTQRGCCTRKKWMSWEELNNQVSKKSQLKI